VSMDFLGGWVNPSRERLPYMLALLPIGLSLCASGALVVARTCDVEIADGQFRFRRLLSWESVPLSAIAKVRVLLAVWVRLDYGTHALWICFSPENYKAVLHPLPIVGFLRQLCAANRAKQVDSLSDFK